MNTEILYEDVKNEVLNHYEEELKDFKSKEDGWNGKSTHKIKDIIFEYTIEFISKLHYELRKRNYNKINLDFFDLAIGDDDLAFESHNLVSIDIDIDDEKILIYSYIQEDEKTHKEKEKYPSFSINVSNIIIPEDYISWLIKKHSECNP